MEKKNTGLIVLITILLVLLLGLSGSIIYYTIANNTEKKSTNNSTDNVDNKEKENFYSFQINYDSDFNKYNIVGYREDESKEEIITLNGDLDHRIKDYDDNKLYLWFNDKLYYINIIDSEKKLSEVDDFNNIYSLEKYPSLIYVFENKIYYIEDETLKVYDFNTKKINTIKNGILWYDFYIDKKERKILYFINSDLYSSNLDGTDEKLIKAEISTGSGFINTKIYKDELILEDSFDGIHYSVQNLYSYSNSHLRLLLSEVADYYITHDNIIYSDNLNKSVYQYNNGQQTVIYNNKYNEQPLKYNEGNGGVIVCSDFFNEHYSRISFKYSGYNSIDIILDVDQQCSEQKDELKTLKINNTIQNPNATTEFEIGYSNVLYVQ